MNENPDFNENLCVCLIGYMGQSFSTGKSLSVRWNLPPSFSLNIISRILRMFFKKKRYLNAISCLLIIIKRFIVEECIYYI